jgi:hypothetical protein
MLSSKPVVTAIEIAGLGRMATPPAVSDKLAPNANVNRLAQNVKTNAGWSLIGDGWIFN